MDTESAESLLKKVDPDRDTPELLTIETQAPLSKRLDDIVKSMQMVNQRLKDLSIERRGQVSHMQFSAIEEFKSSSKASMKQNKFWQKSLFARTYFVDKDLDELFKHVMKYSSMLFTYLNNLNGKVQCKSDIELDTLSTPRMPKSEIPLDSPRESAVAFATGSAQNVSQTTETACGDDEELDNVVDLRSIQQSFTDLIRAKVEFDSQFLKFNAVLSKTSYSEDFHCLYEICAKSNMILEQTSLSLDKCESVGADNGHRLRRKRQSINVGEGQSHLEKRPRRSKRLADVANEVQIIRSLNRIK